MATLVLASGQHVTLLTMAGEQVTLLSPEPAPPGSVLGAHLPGHGVELRIKVRGCQRVEQTGAGAFRLQGRFVNLSRSVRERLLGALE
jgi:hypothetical protein